MGEPTLPIDLDLALADEPDESRLATDRGPVEDEPGDGALPIDLAWSPEQLESTRPRDLDSDPDPSDDERGIRGWVRDRAG